MIVMVFSRYVYDHLGGKHDKVVEELVATLCTYGVTILWLGPCEVVLIWAFFNCFGLNFELWTAKLFSMEPFVTIEVGFSINIYNYFEFVNIFSVSISPFSVVTVNKEHVSTFYCPAGDAIHCLNSSLTLTFLLKYLTSMLKKQMSEIVLVLHCCYNNPDTLLWLKFSRRQCQRQRLEESEPS